MSEGSSTRLMIHGAHPKSKGFAGRGDTLDRPGKERGRERSSYRLRESCTFRTDEEHGLAPDGQHSARLEVSPHFGTFKQLRCEPRDIFPTRRSTVVDFSHAPLFIPLVTVWLRRWDDFRGRT